MALMLHPAVHVHSPWWPRHRLATLTTAHGVDASYTAIGRLGTKDTGLSAFHVATNDPAVVRDPSVINEGNLIVIVAPDCSPWVGPIVPTEEDSSTGLIQFSALSYEALLDNRATPQTEKYTAPIGANAIDRNLLDEANARNHTGISRAATPEIGPVVEELEVGGQSVMEADNELCGRSGYEWWLEYQVSASAIRIIKRFGYQQGYDLRDRCHYYQGTHFSGVFKRDPSQAKHSVTAVGDFGADLPDRNSVTRVASFGPQHLGIASAAIQEADPVASRTLSALPPALRGEKVSFEVMTGSTAELSRRGAVLQERPLQTEQMVSDRFNASVDWQTLSVGNYYTRHGMFRGRAQTVVVRVMGLQPNWEAGTCQVVGWVVQ